MSQAIAIFPVQCSVSNAMLAFNHFLPALEIGSWLRPSGSLWGSEFVLHSPVTGCVVTRLPTLSVGAHIYRVRAELMLPQRRTAKVANRPANACVLVQASAHTKDADTR